MDACIQICMHNHTCATLSSTSLDFLWYKEYVVFQKFDNLNDE